MGGVWRGYEAESVPVWIACVVDVEKRSVLTVMSLWGNVYSGPADESHDHALLRQNTPSLLKLALS
jgi:hypothetical protein